MSFIERERCVVLKAEMWEPGDLLRKVMTTDVESILDENGTRIPRRILLEDRKKGSSQTKFVTKDCRMSKSDGPQKFESS